MVAIFGLALMFSWLFSLAFIMLYPIVTFTGTVLYILWTRGWLMRLVTILSLLVALLNPMACVAVVSVLFILTFLLNDPRRAAAWAAPIAIQELIKKLS